jgi:hypothetical protein
MKQTLVYVVALVIVVSGIGVGSLVSGPTSGITTTNSSMLKGLGLISNATNSFVVNRFGVALVLSLNTSNVASGHAIAITEKVVNILGSMNNVSLGDTFAYDHPGNISGIRIAPCIFPAGVVLFQGYYTAQNLSSGRALWLYSAGESCGVATAQFYLFNPLSDNVTFSNYFMKCESGDSNCHTWYVALEGTINRTGYWTGNFIEPTYHPFGAGIYTIMAVDEWGDLVLLHFAAAPPPELQIETGRTAIPGQQVYLDGIFTNTGTTSIDLSAYEFNLAVVTSQGAIVYSTSCDVLYPNPIAPPGGGWDCSAYWTAGPPGSYSLQAYIHPFAQNVNVTSASMEIIVS